MTEALGAPAGSALPALESARRYLKQHLEVAGLAVLLLATLVLPKRVPLGIYGLGVAGGAGIALQALGVVLVYRANRVINFAQVEIGAVGALLFVEIVRRQTFLVGLHYVCPTCVRVQGVEVQTPSGGLVHFSVPINPPGWMVQANYWLAMVVSIVAVVALAYLAHTLIIRRFTDAPRLILTLVTIGLAQTFLLVEDLIHRAYSDRGASGGTAPLPFHLSFRIPPVTFGTTDIIAVLVGVAAVVGLALFLRGSALGIVLRGAAENPARAESLGVNVRSVTSMAWLLAALLSAISAILSATSFGVTGGSSTTLVRILAAAVIGGMVSFPLTIVAAVVIGMVDQSILWALSSPPLVDGLLVLVIVVVLLLQRSRAGRADTDRESGWRSTREVRPIPAELRDVDVVRRWRRNGRFLAVGLIAGLPWVLSPGQTTVATTAFLYGILALSLLILTGWAGQISLGQFGFAAVGAWTVAVTGWPFPLALLAAALVGAVAAVAVGLPALRLRGLHLAISTLAFAVGVSAIVLNQRYLGRHLPQAVRRPVFLGLNLNDVRVFYYFVLAFLIVAVVATIGIRRSRTARALIGSRENEALAQAFGINLVRIRLSAFAISGFMAAFAGGLFAYAQFGVHGQNFDAAQSINMFLIAVIGGLGSITGPLIGAAFYFVINVFTSNPIVALVATGAGVIILLLFLPGGLSDGVYRIRDAMLRRVADRYRIDVPSLIADGKGTAGERASIAPKQHAGGGKIFVPARYRMGDQWAIESRRKAVTRG